MIDVPIILSAVYPKMRSALGFGKSEKANRSLDIDAGASPRKATQFSAPRGSPASNVRAAVLINESI